MHLLGCRRKQLDSLSLDEVPHTVPIMLHNHLRNHRMGRGYHTAWTPPSLPDSIVLLGGHSDAAKLTAEIVPGFEKWSSFQIFFVTGGGTFELRHDGEYACGIPDEDTIVMTGGGGYPPHDYVTR